LTGFVQGEGVGTLPVQYEDAGKYYPRKVVRIPRSTWDLRATAMLEPAERPSLPTLEPGSAQLPTFESWGEGEED